MYLYSRALLVKIRKQIVSYMPIVCSFHMRTDTERSSICYRDGVHGTDVPLLLKAKAMVAFVIK